jgi:hypothetical protein
VELAAFNLFPMDGAKVNPETVTEEKIMSPSNMSVITYCKKITSYLRVSSFIFCSG